jgi:hypothetical protein
MGRKPSKKIKNKCKNPNCEKEFETVPSLIRDFCSKKCSQQYKGIDKSWLEKRKQTCLDKYGVDVAFKSKEVQDKYKDTLIKKYGVDNPFHLEEVKEKAKKSITQRYGHEIASKNPDIGKKISNSLKGREIPRENFVDIKFDKILKYCEEVQLKPLFDKKYLLDNKINHEFKNKFKFECLKCGEGSEVYLSNGYLPMCKCSNYKGYSLIEEEIIRFLYGYFDEEEIQLNRRDLLSNRMEIDIYIPKLKLAIEVNGIYWHSESMGKYRDYHLFKTEKCLDRGINLIHILDYEWLFKKPIVESIIRNKIKVNKDKIYARKCVMKEIKDTSIVKEFLNNNHIQGYTHASTNLGLYYKQELVSVMTFGKNRFKKNSNEFEMVRFCNKLNTNVVGASSKLLSHFEKNLNPNGLDIISFSDRRFFDGNLYKVLGFEFIKNTSPSYIYWKNYKIKSRMSCQKHKLHKILDVFDNNLSEYENMKVNGWRRIWDCGNSKWVKKSKVSKDTLLLLT